MKDLESIDVKKLPQSVQDLVECIGTAETLKLLKHYGGRMFCVPVDHCKAISLQNILSPKAIKELCHMFGGERIYVPSSACMERQVRNKRIIAARKKGGMSLDALSIKYRLSTRSILIIMETDRKTSV